MNDPHVLHLKESGRYHHAFKAAANSQSRYLVRDV